MASKIAFTNFKYRARDPANRWLGLIESDREVIHRIDDWEPFYRAFGYDNEFRKHEVLPDEFIWQEYFSGTVKKHNPCFQIHLIEYLKNNSASFMEKYKDQCDKWLEAHLKAVVASGKDCLACKEIRAAKYT